VPLDGDAELFWVTYIGQKDLSSNYMFTLEVERSKEETKTRKYVFEATRECIPCDLSHSDVKKKKCALMHKRGWQAPLPSDHSQIQVNFKI